MEGNSGSLGRAWFILGISPLGTTRGEASVGLWGVGQLFHGLKYRPLLLFWECCEARLIAQSVIFSRLDDKESTLFYSLKGRWSLLGAHNTTLGGVGGVSGLKLQSQTSFLQEHSLGRQILWLSPQ
jgi:hypothetical protein